MTSTIWPQEMVDAFKPAYVAPAVGYLASEANTEHTKLLWEVSGGWIAAVRWQRAGGHAFSFSRELKPEAVQKRLPEIFSFDAENASFPASNQEAMMQIMDNIGNAGEDEGDDDDAAGGEDDNSDPEDSDLVKEAKSQKIDESEFTWGERDSILVSAAAVDPAACPQAYTSGSTTSASVRAPRSASTRSSRTTSSRSCPRSPSSRSSSPAPACRSTSCPTSRR